MPGRQLREVLGEHLYAASLPFVEGVLRGEPQVMLRTMVDAAQRTRHTQAWYVPDLSDGEVLGFFVLVTDITAHVDTQRVLEEAARIAQLGSYTWDRRSGLIEWSQEMYRIAGVEPGRFDVSFDGFLGLVHPDDRDVVRTAIRSALAAGTGFQVEHRLVRPDGDVRYVRMQAQAAFAPDGSVQRVAGIALDVTDAERAERELSRLNAELDRANTLQADVIAMLGHEARQPLALVRLLIESVLAAWEDLPEEVKQSELSRATRATYELGRLLDDVLAMTYVESGRAAGNAVPTRVLEAVDRCLALVPGGVVVQVEVDERLSVLAEPWQLRQMIGNLIGNAAKYGAPPVVVAAQREGELVQISVSDRGPGVPETFVPHLFERFTRVQHLGQRGTGFGLYIVRRLAQANRGSVEFRPNKPTGAVFTITLPAAP
jgi:PAS domain S-box-containing protein